jgi:thioredoxin-related protein
VRSLQNGVAYTGTTGRRVQGAVNIYKVNTESEPQLAAAFAVTSIPSILFVPVEGKPHMSMGHCLKMSLSGCSVMFWGK